MDLALRWLDAECDTGQQALSAEPYAVLRFPSESRRDTVRDRPQNVHIPPKVCPCVRTARGKPPTESRSPARQPRLARSRGRG